jgi:polyphosphate kinase
LGTGNYNPKTAMGYEDLGLLSCDPDLGADLTELFNFLTGYSRQTHYRKLLVAPLSLRDRMIELIERETAAPPGTGRIVMKMNSLSDPAIIDALYAASSAGVKVDLIVRSICCLRAGVPGLSENIRVRSIVGRFLEHSRIYHFAHGRDGGEFYLGSADLMPRNLDRRVEVVFPVEDEELCERLEHILELGLADDTEAWDLLPDGTWVRTPSVRGESVQLALRLDALRRARGRRDVDMLARKA